MKKTIYYTKYLGLFILIEIFISFIMSFLNLLGVSTDITNILLFISNLVLFFMYGFKNGKKTNRKGIYEGLVTSIFLVFVMFFITFIFFKSNISIKTLIYYILLISDCTISSTIGKNKKEDSKKSDKI